MLDVPRSAHDLDGLDWPVGRMGLTELALLAVAMTALVVLAALFPARAR